MGQVFFAIVPISMKVARIFCHFFIIAKVVKMARMAIFCLLFWVIQTKKSRDDSNTQDINLLQL
jgi:hypothetical protein